MSFFKNAPDDLLAAAAGPDLRVENHGTICLFRPMTARGSEWIKDTSPEDAQFLGEAMVVEPRCVQGVIDAAEDSALAVAVL